MPFQFTNSLSDCGYEIKVDQMISGTWQSYPLEDPSEVYEPYHSQNDLVLTLDLASNIVNIQTENETKDTGYTREFKLTIGSPTVAEANTAVAELFLTLDVHHPCRTAVLDAPLALSSMETYINGPADSQTIASVNHSMQGSAYDCGLQMLIIIDDPSMPFSSSEILTGSQ